VAETLEHVLHGVGDHLRIARFASDDQKDLHGRKRGAPGQGPQGARVIRVTGGGWTGDP
jgi:hypothetical protein